ncbi:MAG: hypothetical protein ABI402_16250 [Ferruginibacter sp.]
MKKNVLFFVSLILFLSASSQDFSGQWKGKFTDRSSPLSTGQCIYVLDLECHGTSVTGASYTYSTDEGKEYYSICTVTGTIDEKQKYIEIRETERTKTNIPVNLGNCLQIHRLTYFKKGDSTILKGDWIPAPGQGNCGFGSTTLIRRDLKSSFPNLTAAAKNIKKVPEKSITVEKPKKGTSSKDMAKKPVAKHNPPIAKKAPVKINSTVAVRPKIITQTKTNPTAAQVKQAPIKKDFIKNEIIKKDTAIEVPPSTLAIQQPQELIEVPSLKFEKRNNTVLQTIQVKNKTVRVDLYDNGEVDGDSISLFYNGKLLMSSKRLSEKAITLNITVEDDIVNELVMYAENLGTIPPNTALMVVTDGPKRYEVRITSDLEKSGVINFVHKPNGN